MNRRDFVGGLAASGAVTSVRGSLAQIQIHLASAATLTIDASKPGPTIPRDFTGLSYESAQLANPAFFSAANNPLIELFRGLSPSGNLRLGGGSSEFTTYSDAGPISPPPFETFGPDTSKTAKRGTVTTALALRNLRSFLDATGWNCLYGLNLGQGTMQNAAAEAAAAHRILGPRLLAFQIGNEPDSFRNRYRPATYSPADYLREWNKFHDAIVSSTPAAKFSGPDISNKLSYLTAFAEQAPRHKDVILLTAHYYALGPAGSPGATLAQLAAPDPKQATMHTQSFTEVGDAMKTAGLPFRMSEGNSCWNGGQPGVSDTLASALWCADMMLRFAALGWCGVNLHGGGDGIYSPITGDSATGFIRRPEYFGIQFGQQFAGAQFLASTLTGASPQVTAYVLQHNRRRRLAILNKSDAQTSIALPARTTASAIRLTGPGLDSKEGIEFGEVPITPSREVALAGHSGMIYEI